ncbi:unnamed protein product [Periconia digitata]|uniref:Uncharacterized protein n=1 Tax=Periconia digitata TaxID=1303443 RepID=A0A9W4UHB1_9PLEO|nr:unnamed protein product [Periconia digitata]
MYTRLTTSTNYKKKACINNIIAINSHQNSKHNPSIHPSRTLSSYIPSAQSAQLEPTLSPPPLFPSPVAKKTHVSRIPISPSVHPSILHALGSMTSAHQSSVVPT